ncbi:DNA repair protein RecO [Methylomonas sp. HW2-6]|uniref:DNA repair protein RecO n=1 Tax=Methylomonas sp. HW2-6 TaxID=3376687 RepID=UPI004043533D
MDGGAVHLQPAFVLQHRPYRETSLLLDVFTRDFGLVPILAKGVRKPKSKTAGLLLPFSALKLSYVGKNELKVLADAEYVDSYPLQSLALYCGFYVNELVGIFVQKADPQPGVFALYRRCLRELSDARNIEQTLRYFELDLLREAGYAADLAYDVSGEPIVAGRRYNFVADYGMEQAGGGVAGGDTLAMLAGRAALPAEALVEAKALLRKMLDVHLQGRQLSSRAVLAKIIKHL